MTAGQQIDPNLGEIAMHESAHAVVAVKLSTNGRGLPEDGVVTIEPDEFRCGYVCVNDMGAQENILVTLAGGMAWSRLVNVLHKHLGSPEINLMKLRWSTGGDARDIAHYLSHLHPSVPMAAVEWLVFEMNYKLGKPIPATVGASRGAFSTLSAVGREDAKLLADSLVCALIALCGWGDSSTARKVISLNTAFTYPQRLAILGAPWFKTLCESTDKVRDLLDEHGEVICALASRLLEVRTMTGAEAERFIREAGASL